MRGARQGQERVPAVVEKAKERMEQGLMKDLERMNVDTEGAPPVGVEMFSPVV